MLLHNSPLFRIYFGNANDNLFPSYYLNLPPEVALLNEQPFAHLKKTMQLRDLIFLRQHHSTDGFLVTSENRSSINPFITQGDFLITHMPKVGLGIMAGDCLPIVFFDTVNAVIAIVHAGWRGSLAGIAQKVAFEMQQKYGTQFEHVRVFFGPSAKVCCYEIDEAFMANLDMCSYTHQVVQHHGDKLYFDLPLFNRLQLEDIGIRKEAFRLDYNSCTIENNTFFSYRRQGEKSGRQMTVVCVK